MDESRFSQNSGPCQWHNDIQSRLNEVRNLVTNHQQRKLTEEQSERNDVLVNKFVWFKGSKGKTWKQIEKFCCKPLVFQMRELQLYIEDDIRSKHPNISDLEFHNFLK